MLYGHVDIKKLIINHFRLSKCNECLFQYLSDFHIDSLTPNVVPILVKYQYFLVTGSFVYILYNQIKEL